MKTTTSKSVLALCLMTFALASHAAPLDTDGDGIPDTAEVLLGTDPLLADTNGDGISDRKDPHPLLAPNPIAAKGKVGGLVLESAKVEDNFDPVTKKGVNDHLEMVLRNPGGSVLKGVQVFYSMTDKKSGKVESYYRNLTGVSVAPSSSVTLHFEESGSIKFDAATTDFRINPNSILYKSPNGKTITLVVASPGYAPSTLTFNKDPGGAEKAD